MASGKREKDETYEEYRKRLKIEAIVTKMALKGKLFWHGSQGTYRKGMEFS